MSNMAFQLRSKMLSNDTCLWLFYQAKIRLYSQY